VQRQAVDGELEAELRFHVERQTAENIAAGMSARDARNAAMREFGAMGQYREECREMRRVNWLQDFVQDLRYGARVLLKNKGFAAIAVVTLALGIGANTAIFSLIDAVMLRTLPIRDPLGLHMLRWHALHDPSTNISYNFSGCPGDTGEPTAAPSDCNFSYPMFQAFLAEKNMLSSVAAFAGPKNLHVNSGGEGTTANAFLVSGDFFGVTGTHAAIGRTLESGDDRSGAPSTAVVSYNFWRSRFGGDPSIVGKTVELERKPFVIVGVTAPEFSGLDPGIVTDLWIPLARQTDIYPYLPKQDAANCVYLQILGRINPHVTEPQAQSALSVVFANASTSGAKPIFKPGDAPTIQLESVAHGMTSLRDEYSQPLFVLMASVGIVLLIACANVGGLSLARATSRRAEIAMRFTLGASRGRILRQLLTESLMISASGATLGVLVAYWSAEALAGFFAANSYFALDLNVAPNLRILAFTVAVAVLTGMLFGFAPALQGMRLDVTPALKGAAGTKSALFGERRFGAGNLLIVGQVALSVVVLAGAGLLVHTLVKLRRMDTGFRAEGVLVFNVDMSMKGYDIFTDPRVYPMDRELQTRFAGLPGVTSASYSMMPLLSGGSSTTSYRIPGDPGNTRVDAYELPVGPGFIETMNIRLLAGRTFTAADFVVDTAKAPAPVILNESLARALFGAVNPVGRIFGEGDRGSVGLLVIGVTAGAKYDSLRKDMPPTAYVMDKFSGGSFEVRTSGSPKALIPLVREAVKQIDASLLVSHFKTQEEQIDQLLYQERLVASLSALFGALALLLDCIGLYGLLSYEVARRTREIGIRMALGAPRREVLRLFVARGLALVAAGGAIGVAAAIGITRYLESLLYGVRPTDPWTLGAAIVALAAVGVIACSVPARRAMRVDPMVALRYE
jgi:predicted permease